MNLTQLIKAVCVPISLNNRAIYCWDRKYPEDVRKSARNKCRAFCWLLVPLGGNRRMLQVLVSGTWPVTPLHTGREGQWGAGALGDPVTANTVVPCYP